MRKALPRLALVVLLTGLCLISAALGWGVIVSAAPPAQTDDILPPSIIRFVVDLSSVTVDEVEAGTARATLAWETVGLTDTYRLMLHYFVINDWRPVTPEALPPNGAAQIPVLAPLDFGPPTYRLSIFDQQERVISQQFLTIPYAPPSEDLRPVIESFEANVSTLNENVLAANQARVILAWKVTNRLPTSNLIFEQVLADGQVVSVELPRLSRWIMSSGEGMVAPVSPGADAVVRLRLRVVDMIDGTVYAEEEISLLVIGGAAPPTATTAPEVTGTEEAPPDSTPTPSS